MLSAADALLCLIIHLNMYMIQRHQQNPNKTICGSSEPRHQYSKLSLTAWWRTGGHSATWKDASLGSSKCKVSGFTQVTWQFLNQNVTISQGYLAYLATFFAPACKRWPSSRRLATKVSTSVNFASFFFRFQDFWKLPEVSTADLGSQKWTNQEAPVRNTFWSIESHTLYFLEGSKIARHRT